MNYLTSKELSAKWGIGQRRIILLAREGRIPGAKIFGKTWVFPEDAVKPIDGRTRLARGTGDSGDCISTTDDDYAAAENFRFPNFEYKDAASFYPPLSDEELTLKTFVEHFNSCRFNEANKMSDSLPVRSSNRYIRIHALYCVCMIAIVQCDTRRFFDCFGKLRTESVIDLPHMAEMREFIHEIEATLGMHEYYVRRFNAKPLYNYHESFLPRLCNLESYCLTLGEPGISPIALSACEFNCRFLEGTDNYLDLQAMHIFLGAAYAIEGRTTERDYHFDKALGLADKYDLFFNLATQYYYMRKDFKPALSNYPEELKDRLNRISNKLHNYLTRFVDAIQLNSFYAMLTNNDYIYVVYAVQGLSNKEVASRLHIPIGSVGKKYGNIYALFGVESKAQLVELYHSTAKVSKDVKGTKMSRGRVP